MAKRRARKPSRDTPARRKPATSSKPSKAARKTAVRPRVAQLRKPSTERSIQPGGKKPKRKKAKPSKKVVPVTRSRKQAKRINISARSFAAKKGWLTRRYNQQVKEIQERFERRDREYQRELRKQARAIAAKEKVIVYTKEQLREKGKEVTESFDKAFRKAKKEADREMNKKVDIIERLWQAQVEGDFDEVAYGLAEEYDMDPKEIYTIWHYNGGID